MPGADVNSTARVSVAQGAPAPDAGAAVLARSAEYLERSLLGVVPTKHMLADEGSYWTFTTGAPGAPITTTIPRVPGTGVSDFGPFLVVFNTDSSPLVGRRVYLDYIRLVITTAPTGSFLQYFAKVDMTANRLPLGSAGTQYLAAPSGGAAGSVPALVLGSPGLGGVGGTGEQVARGVCSPQLQPTVGQELVFTFGAARSAPAGAVDVGGTALGRFVSHLPPVVLGPGQLLMFYPWVGGALGTTMGYEGEVGLWAR